MGDTAWTPRPARGYSRAPFGQGNTVAVKHGAHSPRFVDPLAAQLTTSLLERRADLAAYPEEVAAWARAEARCLLIEEWLAQPRSDRHRLAAANLSVSFENLAARRRIELGLTPLSEARLRRDRAEAQAVVYDLDAVREEGRRVLEARRSPVEAPPGRAEAQEAT